MTLRFLPFFNGAVVIFSMRQSEAVPRQTIVRSCRMNSGKVVGFDLRL
jgi:hypothetical protein